MPGFNGGPLPAKRILVTRMKFIGDVVLTTPLLHSLRAAYPSAYIAYMAEARACSLLEHHPAVDELIGYDFTRPSVLEELRVALALRRSRFDITLDLFSNPRSALLMYLSGARVRVGLARAGRGHLFTHQVHDDGTPKTAIQFHNQFLHAIGVAPTRTQPMLVVTAGEKEMMQRRLQATDPADGRRVPGDTQTDRNPRLVVLHVGATWPAKQWGAEQYAKLASLLVRSAGVRILLTGGPRDEATLMEVEEKSQRTARRAGALTLRELAALLSLADAFVGNDGGPMHISAAVGTPTVGIFGPGEEQIWFPYPESLGHRALREDVPCHPCHLNVCNRPGESSMECMKKLTPERVLDAVLRALDHTPARPDN
jgi:lipopolysaccharide heptosyltransferase II